MRLESTLLLIAMSVAAGVMGCFVVMRRMVLAADALSHVALPGIGIALLFGVHPLVGALAALLLGTALIWGIEQRSRLATETVIGVVFSSALALGSLLTSGEELIDALFGKAAKLAPWELYLALAAALGVIGFLTLRRHAILVALFSRDIAASMGVRLRWLDLQFMLAFAITVALGLRYLGVLLMGALVIIPAAVARRLASNLRGMLTVAVSVAVVATLLGALVAARLGSATGPPIVMMAAAFFVLSLLKKPTS